MKNLVVGVVLIVALVLIVSAFGHLLVLGACVAGGFALGNASGYARGRLAGRHQRRLGAVR